ncbi:MAG: transposase [Phycisphaerales bacterium]|nr:transposase [Phycisphaerales bacterium]
MKAEHAFSGGYDSVKRFCLGGCKGARAAVPADGVRCGRGSAGGLRPRAPVLGAGRAGVEGRRILGIARAAALPPPARTAGGAEPFAQGYSEVVERQTTDNFIRCLENAFQHFGGVPRMLVIDNLKAAVTKADWFDPELNPKLQAFAEHCGTVIVPTRPYTPRHKGKVERGVDYVQENAQRPDL